MSLKRTILSQITLLSYLHHDQLIKIRNEKDPKREAEHSCKLCEFLTSLYRYHTNEPITDAEVTELNSLYETHRIQIEDAYTCCICYEIRLSGLTHCLKHPICFMCVAKMYDQVMRRNYDVSYVDLLLQQIM